MSEPRRCQMCCRSVRVEIAIPNDAFAWVAYRPPDGGYFCADCLDRRLSRVGLHDVKVLSVVGQSLWLHNVERTVRAGLPWFGVAVATVAMLTVIRDYREVHPELNGCLGDARCLCCVWADAMLGAAP